MEHVTIDSEADLDRGIAALCALDERFGEIRTRTGRPPLRRRAGGFYGLLDIVVAQQVSRASAAAIWARLTAGLAPVTPENFRRYGEEDLRGVGLSGPKVRTVQAVTRAVLDGTLDFRRLEWLGDEEVRRELTAVKGIGPWTAEIYLLACLGRSDAWPAGDLAIQEAARTAFRLASRPDAKALRQLSEPWSPWRGVAARLLWSYYALTRSRDAAP